MLALRRRAWKGVVKGRLVKEDVNPLWNLGATYLGNVLAGILLHVLSASFVFGRVCILRIVRGILALIRLKRSPLVLVA
jgi:hypothetical protein